MRIILLTVLLVLLVVCGMAVAPPRRPAKTLLSSDPLLRVKTVSFQVLISTPTFQQSVPGGKIIGQTFTIIAARPNRLCVRDMTDWQALKTLMTQMQRPWSGTGWDEFRSDGPHQIEISVPRKRYVTGSAAASLDGLTGKKDLPALLHLDVLFGSDVVAQFRRVGDCKLDGVPAVLYRYRVAGSDYSTEYQLFMARTTGLPIRLSVFDQAPGGKMVEVQRSDYSHWNLHPVLTPTTFDTTPPEGMQPESSEVPASPGTKNQ